MVIVVLNLFFDIQAKCQQIEPSYSSAVEKNIHGVENNLAGWVQLIDSNIRLNLSERMKFYKVKGVSIAVVHNYKLEWARGYGWSDSSEQRLVTTKTLFQAASISKSLNAIGVLKLAQEGKIGLNTDINNYLKSWKFPYDSVSKNNIITIGNLLTHTAGLTVHGFPGYAFGDTIPTVIEILDGRKPANSPAVRSQFAPNLRFEYSGGGILITQLIITDQTGEKYDQFQWKNTLEPMGMTESFFSQPPPSNQTAILATGYQQDGSEIKGKFHIYPEMAPAGLWTNPSDLAKYIIETQLSYEGRSSKVLTPAFTKIRLMPFDSSTIAAMGVFVHKIGNRTYFEHGGANEGFRSQYYGSLEGGDGVIVMVNSDDGNIISEIIHSVAIVYEWKDFYRPVLKKITPVSTDTLDTYTGNYILGNSSIVIKRIGNQLFLRQDSNNPLPLNFTSNSDFFLFEINAECKFVKNEYGKTTSIAVKQNGNQFSIIKKN